MLLPEVYEPVLTRLVAAYKQVLTRLGDPLHPDTLLGPLHSQTAVQQYLETIEEAKKLGGKVEVGGKVSN